MENDLVVCPITNCKLHVRRGAFRRHVCDQHGNWQIDELHRSAPKEFGCAICVSTFSTFHTMQRHFIHSHGCVPGTWEPRRHLDQNTRRSRSRSPLHNQYDDRRHDMNSHRFLRNPQVPIQNDQRERPMNRNTYRNAEDDDAFVPNVHHERLFNRYANRNYGQIIAENDELPDDSEPVWNETREEPPNNRQHNRGFLNFFGF